jgi:hypothetical protein
MTTGDRSTDRSTQTTPKKEHRMLKTLFSGKRKYAAIGLAVLVIPSSAMAAWFITAHGQANAHIGRLQAPTVVQGQPPAGSMLPGQTGPGAFAVTNPNSSALEVYATAVGDGTAITYNDEDCPASNITAVATTLATPITIPPGTTQIVVPDTVKLSANAPTGCQGRDLSVDVELKFRTPTS